ncbi:sensor histidine kinase [Amycolatopsis sp. NPDC059657]|uniref:sensor histidine kinase n=1 Tax=Amycolatopsis sp. NPDC059657 TaxID=3346899 RepID=UPI00366C7CC2
MREITADRLARFGPVVLFANFAFVAAVNSTSARQMWLGLALTVCSGALHLRHVTGAHRFLPLTLPAQALLGAATFIPAGPWPSVLGFLTGALLVSVRQPWGGVLFGVVIGALAVVDRIAPWGPFAVPGLLSLTLATYLFARLPVLIRDVGAVRAELAELASTGERLAAARQAHDVLAEGLGAIAAKGRMAAAVAATDPELSTRLLTELTTMARLSRADLDELSTAGRPLSLTAETAEAGRRLALAGGRCRTDIRVGANLDPVVDNVLAWAVREGLAGSAPRECTITVTGERSAYRLELVNDAGAPGSLNALVERVAVVGGRSKVTTGSGFRLVVEVPAR